MNDVHVWIAAIDNPISSLHTFAQTLSHDEHKKAARYCFERDKKRYIIGRGVLRSIIGNYYLGIEPSRLEFCYGSHGKPFLEERFGDGKFRFNQTYSQGLALYAFTKDHEVGVDIEYMRNIADAQQIVNGSFTETEKAAFNALLDREKQEAFFNCWTRKEAYIKAIGKGLYCPLDQFDVSLAPREPARLLYVTGHPEEASQWSLKSFTPEINYKAALAVRSNDCNISYWRFPW